MRVAKTSLKPCKINNKFYKYYLGFKIAIRIIGIIFLLKSLICKFGSYHGENLYSIQFAAQSLKQIKKS